MGYRRALGNETRVCVRVCTRSRAVVLTVEHLYSAHPPLRLSLFLLSLSMKGAD